MPLRNVRQGCTFCQGVREGVSEEVLFALRHEYQERVSHAVRGSGNRRCKGPEARISLLCPRLKGRWPTWLE